MNTTTTFIAPPAILTLHASRNNQSYKELLDEYAAAAQEIVEQHRSPFSPFPVTVSDKLCHEEYKTTHAQLVEIALQERVQHILELASSMGVDTAALKSDLQLTARLHFMTWKHSF